MTGASVLLVIEIADTTMRLDLQKAAIYARGGVREFWLIDVGARHVLVHRLHDSAYGEPTIINETQAVSAAHISGLSLRIADLPRL